MLALGVHTEIYFFYVRDSDYNPEITVVNYCVKNSFEIVNSHVNDHHHRKGTTLRLLLIIFTIFKNYQLQRVVKPIIYQMHIKYIGILGGKNAIDVVV